MNMHAAGERYDWKTRRQSSDVDYQGVNDVGHRLMVSTSIHAYKTPEANSFRQNVDGVDEGFSSGRASSTSVHSAEASPPHSSRPSSSTLPALRRRSSVLSDDGFEIEAMSQRPGSSRYHILPSIGQTSYAEASVHEARSRTLSDGQEALRKAEPPGQKNNVDSGGKVAKKSRGRLQKDIKSPGKHSLNVKSENPASDRSKPPVSIVDQHVMLAVKLPSGQRIEHQFQCSEKLSDVLHYVEVIAQQSFTNCEFVSADLRAVLTDLNVTIASSGIQNRSVLYVQLPDE